MAAPLAMYFVPTVGSGTIGELIAATVEMAIGGQWGTLTILEGLIQGTTNEIGFFPKSPAMKDFLGLAFNWCLLCQPWWFYPIIFHLWLESLSSKFANLDVYHQYDFFIIV